MLTSLIALDKYIKQIPEENIIMFEEMDKERKHGTWFYPLLYHEKEKTRKTVLT